MDQLPGSPPAEDHLSTMRGGATLKCGFGGKSAMIKVWRNFFCAGFHSVANEEDNAAAVQTVNPDPPLQWAPPEGQHCPPRGTVNTPEESY